MYRVQASGVALLLSFAISACDANNKTNVECRADDCRAVCLDLGYQDGQCDEEDICICEEADSGPYWWGDGGTDDDSTDSNTSSSTDSSSSAVEAPPRGLGAGSG
jgi:hypothetical protein